MTRADSGICIWHDIVDFQLRSVPFFFQYDWQLRGAFFDSIVGVAAYVGWQSSTILKPLLEQVSPPCAVLVPPPSHKFAEVWKVIGHQQHKNSENLNQAARSFQWYHSLTLLFDSTQCRAWATWKNLSYTRRCVLSRPSQSWVCCRNRLCMSCSGKSCHFSVTQ